MRAILRLWSLMTLFFYVSLNVGEALHLSLIPHAICAQHGDLTHADPTHAHNKHNAPYSAGDLPVLTSDDHSKEDPHCTLLSCAPRKLIWSQADAQLHTAILYPPIARYTNLIFGHAIAVFRLSPSTSPPA